MSYRPRIVAGGFFMACGGDAFLAVWPEYLAGRKSYSAVEIGSPSR
jgi:hypothetical protein